MPLLVEFFALGAKTAAAMPAPYRNPETKYHHWFHGTYFEPDEEHEEEHGPGGRLEAPDRHPYEYGMYADKHWNTDLGVHFTSDPDVADTFATGGHAGSRANHFPNARVAHARLHMANPKHYDSEFDMTHDAIKWAHENGHHYLNEGARHDDQWEDHLDSGGHYAEIPDHEHMEYVDNETDAQTRRALDSIDRGGTDASHPQEDRYLSLHPDREDITAGFKQHLESKGHDGITYGNEYEPPRGHTCAIAFHPEQINMDRWHWNHPSQEHLNDPEKPEPPRATQGEALLSPNYFPGKGHHWVDSEGQHLGPMKSLLQHFAADEHYPLSWDELDEHLEHAFHPQQLDARREKHPKSGHNVEVGEERRLDHVADDVPDYADKPLSEWSVPARLKVRDYGQLPDRPWFPTEMGHEPLQHVYRGVSMEEYHQAKERGHLQSDLRGVISENEGTNAAVDPRSAISYLPPGQHGMVLKIKAKPEHDWRMIRADNYVRTANPIPMSDVEHAEPYSKSDRTQVYAGHVPEHVLHDERLRSPRTALLQHFASGEPLYRQPKPEHVSAPEDATDEERSAHFHKQLTHRNKWTHEVRRAMSRGDLDPQEAWDNGYTGQGHDQSREPFRRSNEHGLSWEHLPQTLWHVTTNKSGVLAAGTLKSRDELNMNHGGTGLGGGETDTISLTHDPDVARHIHRALHEYHSVLNGKTTPRDLMQQAHEGGFEKHIVYGQGGPHPDEGKWQHGDAYPEGLQDIIDGTRTHMGTHTHEEARAKYGDDVRPVPGAKSPVDFPDGQERHHLWRRPATAKEKFEDRSGLYKTFSTWREFTGGHMDPGFIMNSPQHLAETHPSQFSIIRLHPKPGARGYRVSALGEWRTADGSALHIGGTESPHEDQGLEKQAMGLHGPDYTGLKFDVEPDGDEGYALTARHHQHGEVGRLKFTPYEHEMPVDIDNPDITHIEVHHLKVEPEHRRRGVGSALMQHMDSWGLPIDHGGRTEDGRQWARSHYGPAAPDVTLHGKEVGTIWQEAAKAKVQVYRGLYLSDEPDEFEGEVRRRFDPSRPAGSHWSADEEVAKAHAMDFLHGSGGAGMVLHGEVDPEHIMDRADIDPDRGVMSPAHFEREHFIAPGSPVDVHQTSVHWHHPETWDDDGEHVEDDWYDEAHQQHDPPLRMKAKQDTGFLPNPYHDHDEWFHGSLGDHEDLDPQAIREGHAPAGNGAGGPQMNKLLGVHFSALHAVAHSFAGPHRNQHGRVFHAQLKMKNPIHFDSEESLLRHVWNTVGAGSGFHDQKHEDNMQWQYGSGATREGINQRIARGASPRQTHSAIEAHFLWHPRQHEMAGAYVSQLRYDGHDGITYGNNVEGPNQHYCAIAFDPKTIKVTHTDLMHPTMRPEEAPASWNEDWKQGLVRQPGAVSHAHIEDIHDEPADFLDEVNRYHNNGSVERWGRSDKGNTGKGEWKYHQAAKVLPVEQGLYWRFHHKDAPFGPDHASTQNIGEAPQGLEHHWQPKEGYSAFWHPDHLDQYIREQGWDTAEDAKDRRVISFRGTPVGEGADGEPRVMPHSGKTEHSLTLQRFRDRMPEAGTRWGDHTWGEGPDGQVVDDGYRTLGKESALLPGYTKEHPWLPTGKVFAPGKGCLDARLFDHHHLMRPHVKRVIMDRLNTVLAGSYPDWQQWSRVYLAGSEASEWWGNNDFDTLVGVHYGRFRKAHPEQADLTDDQISDRINAIFRRVYNDEEWKAPWDGQVWHLTGYVNPDSWNIRKIKPYAAYDMSDSRWSVKPVKVGADWGPQKWPEGTWEQMEAYLQLIGAIEHLPQPQQMRQGAALYDFLHSDRRRAFSDHGTGWDDPGNVIWKALDLHPSAPLDKLVSWKHQENADPGEAA